MQPIKDIAQARSGRMAQAWSGSPLLADVVEVLLDFAGAAHQDLLVKEVAWRRTREPASDGLRRDILDTLQAHYDGARAMGMPAMVRRAFGPDSRRWELTPDARDYMAKAEAEACRPVVALSAPKAAAKVVRLRAANRDPKVTKRKINAATG